MCLSFLSEIKMMPFIFFVFITVTLLFLLKILDLKVSDAIQFLVYFTCVFSGQVTDISSYYIFSYFCFITVVVYFVYILINGLSYTLGAAMGFVILLLKLIFVNTVLMFFLYIFTHEISSVFALISITSLLQVICSVLFIMMVKIYIHCRLKQEDKTD